MILDADGGVLIEVVDLLLLIPEDIFLVLLGAGVTDQAGTLSQTTTP